MSTESGSPSSPTLVKIQTVAISIVGALALILLAVSKAVSGKLAATLNDVSGILGIVCAVIGVTFAFTAGKAKR